MFNFRKNSFGKVASEERCGETIDDDRYRKANQQILKHVTEKILHGAPLPFGLKLYHDAFYAEIDLRCFANSRLEEDL
ncbi:MAG: hypothetical protein L7F78_19765 [Syntrophales bacterium LBB04]|nr:hypothetical protein [Syntrophales bacterium LBB04]